MIADIAYLSPFAFKFFKGFAIGAYNLSKRGYETVTAFTENGWVKLKDYYAKVKQTLAKGGVVVEELESVGGLSDLLRNPTFKALYEPLENGTLIRKYSQYAVTTAEEASLKLYIQEYYYTEFNKALAGEISMTAEYAAMKSLIISAATKLPKEVGRIVFRGAGATESAFARTLTKGQSFNFGGRVTSSAITEYTADLFRRGRNGDIIWKIESKNGVNLSSINPSEGEIIFKPNTQFELIDIVPSATTPNVQIYKIREL
jgi:NAD:arginine ADP-ribosyltransferase